MHVSSGEGDGQELDFDLNLAPIIDCFTVLITFLLVTASYVSISILEASVASQEVSTEPAAAQPGVSVSVDVKNDGTYELKITGDENKLIPIPGPDVASQNKELRTQLTDLKKRWADTKMLTVSGDENVEYQRLVKVMEVSREFFPSILMGGF